MRRTLYSIAVIACLGCGGSPRHLTSDRVAAIQDSVRSALGDFRRYAATARWDSLAQLYSADSSFRWIENGKRYGAPAMRRGLASMQRGIRVETTYDSVEVAVLGPGLAELTTYYQTRFVGAPPPVQFGGAISMVWVHEPQRWRILAGHSSSTLPGGRSD